MNNFWRSLDDNPVGFGVTAEWRSSLGADFDPARMPLFQALEERSESYPCLHGCGCSHRVVEHSPTDLFAVCDCEEGCEDLTLKPDDIVVWQLSLPRLARALARALELDSKCLDFKIWGVTPLGTWSTDGIPVMLVIPHTGDHFRKAVAELSARLKERFVVFVPTCRHVDLIVRQILAAGQAAWFPLETTVTVLPSGLLQARQSPNVLFAKFRTDPPPGFSFDEIRKLYALVLLGDSEQLERKAPLKRVFDLYCREGLTADEVAVRCRCSKATILNRLNALQQRTGVPPEKLRAFQPMFADIETALTDPRAKRIREADAIYGEDPDEDLL